MTSNPNALVLLPNENEWYEAASYDSATQSYTEFGTFGFRIAAFPEPHDGLLAAIGMLVLLPRRRN